MSNRPRSYRVMPPKVHKHQPNKERDRREHPSTSRRMPASPEPSHSAKHRVSLNFPKTIIENF
jgi:hypothetical protein